MKIKNKLGSTDIKIFPLGYGGMALKKLDFNKAKALLNKALDNGIDYIDTSPCYGKSEKLIGESISHRRNEYILATKCGHKISSEGEVLGNQEWSKENILKSVEFSLENLQTEYIDLLQLHNINPTEDTVESDHEVIEVLKELKNSGKVKNIGVSFRNSKPGDKLCPDGYGYLGLKKVLDWDVFDVIQVVYGALNRKSEEQIKKASNKGVGIIVRGVLKRYYNYYKKLFYDLDLDELADENMTSFLIRYVLNTPGISGMIIGTKNTRHLEQNINVVKKHGELSKDLYIEAQNRLEEAGIKPGHSPHPIDEYYNK